jgi:hypothetical protein
MTYNFPASYYICFTSGQGTDCPGKFRGFPHKVRGNSVGNTKYMHCGLIIQKLRTGCRYGNSTAAYSGIVLMRCINSSLSTRVLFHTRRSKYFLRFLVVEFKETNVCVCVCVCVEETSRT